MKKKIQIYFIDCLCLKKIKFKNKRRRKYKVVHHTQWPHPYLSAIVGLPFDNSGDYSLERSFKFIGFPQTLFITKPNRAP